MGFPSKRRHRQASTTVSCRHHARLPELIISESICNSRQIMYMLRLHYQQRHGLQRHMVTDWVDWLQVCITLMPGGLSLQMSLSLLTLTKNILLTFISFLFAVCLFVTLLIFSSLYLWPYFFDQHATFNKLLIYATLMTLVSGWSFSQYVTHSFMPSMPPGFSCPHQFLFITACMSFLMNLSRERWAMEKRTGPMLSPVKRERVDAKYRPPSQPL